MDQMTNYLHMKRATHRELSPITAAPLLFTGLFRPFFTKTFSCVTVGKAQIIKLMMAEFNLSASVSVSWYHACWLTVTLLQITKTHD